MNIDPKIRLVTICDANGNIIFYRHREGVQNLLSKDESKKSLEMAMAAGKYVMDFQTNSVGECMFWLSTKRLNVLPCLLVMIFYSI